jgi:G:T/U-mismatch repair DNA glycosylase
MRPSVLPCLLTLTVLAGAETAAPPTLAKPRLEIAILLDTSGSMDGLINQARSRLWAIVNDLSRSTKDGAIPDLRVALYEYGNNRHPASRHWIRRLQPLTDDLDAISEALFALTTDGSTECCGAVIAEAIRDLKWSSADGYRAIFIAGNEEFTQGSVPWREAVSAAVARGIVVNTIHCGDEGAARSGAWFDAARAGDGQCLIIDQGAAEVVAIAAPQDTRILELNTALNATYLAYGTRGAEGAARQVAQDANAVGAAPTSAPAVAVERATAKASASYRNSSWDLVDAVNDKVVALADMKEEELPAEMKGMTPEQRTAHVAAKAAERQRLQTELATLVREREVFVAAERAKQAPAEAATGFGSAMRAALAGQLAARGFAPAPAPAPAP